MFASVGAVQVFNKFRGFLLEAPANCGLFIRTRHRSSNSTFKKPQKSFLLGTPKGPLVLALQLALMVLSEKRSNLGPRKFFYGIWLPASVLESAALVASRLAPWSEFVRT